ncbi:MAG TPA: thiamine pyrophosphate-binding protein, partial [Thermoanaerobaculia bacterium]|nr:thiamine pyrophosphate-binding protein [Thermoanaerobaculia bacterium]
MNGGAHLAQVLEAQGVRFLFTLCGGHISPILVEAKRRGIRVVDVRHEATAVFAADAVARLTGVPGVAAVTAGPGVTNTVTALQNAAMAESPLVVLGGATATLLKGRGALQDIDQLSLVRPLVKQAFAARRVRELAPALERAFQVALDGVPGPVFVECPVDLLYDRELVEGWYGGRGGKGVAGRLVQSYLSLHARRLFAGAGEARPSARLEVAAPEPEPAAVARAARLLSRARRPVLVVGSGAVAEPAGAAEVAAAVERLGMPTYLAGMARGLLGADHRLQLRHARTPALREADLVVLAGFPVDFRLDYGRKIARKAKIVAAGRDPRLLERNRRPTVTAVGDAGRFLRALAGKREGKAGGVGAAAGDPGVWSEWLGTLRARDAERDAEIARQAEEEAPPVNPILLLRELEAVLPDDSILVADGGDFVATASYVLRPRGPLRWLDPGPFGTLGVGAGFALGAKLCRPEAEVWLLYGDGSAGYSLAEVDTFVRHGVAVIAVVGNDAAWMQIARDQVEILGDAVGTVLRR